MRKVCAFAAGGAGSSAQSGIRSGRHRGRVACVRASRRRSPSSRIRPTARCSSSSSRAAASAWCAERHGARHRFPRLSAARSSSGGEQGLLGLALAARLRRAAAASSSTSPTAPATPSSRASGAARRSARRRSRVAVRSALERRRRPGVHRAAVRESQRRQPRVRSGRLISTSASATAARATIRGNRAQNPTELLGKMLRIDVNVPTDDAIGYHVPADNPFVSRRAGGGAARDLGVRPAQSVALQLRRSGARRHRRAGHRRRRPERVGRNRLRAGRPRRPQLRLAQSRRARTTTSPRAPPAYLPLTDPIHEYDHAVGQSITGGYVYRGTALPANYRGRYFFADYVAGAGLVGSACRSTRNGEARASDRDGAHRALSQLGALGNVSSFGVDADGELFIVSYSRGAILRLVSTGPTTPTGLRIVRP